MTGCSPAGWRKKKVNSLEQASHNNSMWYIWLSYLIQIHFSNLWSQQTLLWPEGQNVIYALHKNNKNTCQIIVRLLASIIKWISWSSGCYSVSSLWGSFSEDVLLKIVSSTSCWIHQSSYTVICSKLEFSNWMFSLS